MTRLLAALLLLALPAAATAQDAKKTEGEAEWGAPKVDYIATMTFSDPQGRGFAMRFVYTEQRQRLEYKAGGRDDEVTIIDEVENAVFVMRPALKLYRRAIYVRPDYDFGVAREDTKRERLGAEKVGAFDTVRWRVETTTQHGDRFRGLAWLSPERIVLQMDGEVIEGAGNRERKRKFTLRVSDLKIGPVDPALFKVPADFKLLPADNEPKKDPKK